MSSNLRLAFIIEAVDKATAHVTKINRTIDKLTEPARRVRAAFSSLVRESRFDRVSAAWKDLAERGQGLMAWGRSAATTLFGVAAAGVAATLGLKGVADHVDQLNDTAAMLGVTTQRMQRGGYAAQMAGSSSDEYAQSLIFLNKNMAAARDGNAELLLTFARVGITLDDLRRPGFDAMTAFERMADTYQRVGDGGNNANKKVAISTALLGRSGFRMIQMMNGGSAAMRLMYAEADRLGVVLSDRTVRSMADFNDSWDRLRMTAMGAIATASVPAISALQGIADRVTEWTAANRGLIASRMAEFVERVLPRLPAFAEAVLNITGAAVGLVMGADAVAQSLGGWETVLAVLAVVTGMILGNGLLAVYSLTTAAWGLGVALMATPFGWVAVGIAALAAGAALVIKYWEPIKAFFDGIWKSVGRFFSVAKVQVDAGHTENPRGSWGGGGPGAPVATGPRGTAAMGGVLKIAIDSEGRPSVTQLKKTPGSMLDFDLQYAGGVMR